MSAKGER